MDFIHGTEAAFRSRWDRTAVKTKHYLSANRGFTLIETMIVVAIAGLLTVITVVNFMLARDTSRLNVIQRNSRSFGETLEQGALENRHLERLPTGGSAEASGNLRGGPIRVVIHDDFAPDSISVPPFATLPYGAALRRNAVGETIEAP